MPALCVLLRRRPLLSHLLRRPLRLRLWPRLRLRARLLDASARLRRGLPNRLLTHLRLRPHLLLPLRGPLPALRGGLGVRLPACFHLLLHRGALLPARGESLLTLGLPLRLLLLPRGHPFPLRALPLGHARSPVVRRLRRGRLRRYLLLLSCRTLLLGGRSLLLPVLSLQLLQPASGFAVSASRLRRERRHLLTSLLIHCGRAPTPWRLTGRGPARFVTPLRGRARALVPELKLLPLPAFGDCLDT